MKPLTIKERRFVDAREQWAAWPTDPRYSVSTEGRLRGRGGGIITGNTKSGTGYVLVCVDWRNEKFYSAHRMVLEAFVGPANGLECNHRNGVRNDNRLVNLEWCSAQENQRHSWRVLGRQPVRGVRVGSAKFSDDTIACIRQAVASGRSHRDVGREFQVSIGYISRLHRNHFR